MPTAVHTTPSAKAQLERIVVMAYTPVSIRQITLATRDVVEWLDELGLPLVSVEDVAVLTTDAETVISPAAFTHVVLDLAEQLAADAAIADGRTYRPQKRYALRQCLGRTLQPGQDTEHVVPRIIELIERRLEPFQPVIYRHALTLATGPTRTSDAIRADFITSIVKTYVASVAALVASALALEATGQTVTSLTIPRAGDNDPVTFGQVTLEPVASDVADVEPILQRRMAQVQSPMFQEHYARRLAKARSVTGAYLRGHASFQKLYTSLRAVEVALDRHQGPIDVRYDPTLRDRADQSSFVAWAAEEAFARTCGVASPIWPLRIAAIEALARLPLTASYVETRHHAHRQRAVALVDTSFDRIQNVALEMIGTGSMDGATFRRRFVDQDRHDDYPTASSPLRDDTVGGPIDHSLVPHASIAVPDDSV